MNASDVETGCYPCILDVLFACSPFRERLERLFSTGRLCSSTLSPFVFWVCAGGTDDRA